MKKEFLSNIFLLLGLNLLIKPLYVIGIEAEVQNIVGTQSYGLYYTLFNLCFIFQFVLDLGIQNFNSRYISEDRNRFVPNFSKILGTKLFLALVFGVLCIIAFFSLNYAQVSLSLMLLVALQMTLISFLMFVRGSIAALGFFRADSLLSALDKFLLLLLLGYIIYFSTHKITITDFVLCQLTVTGFTLLIAVIFLFSKHHFPSVSFSFDYSRKLIKQTYPFAIVLLIMTLYTKMDGVMLSRMIDDNELQTGIYAAGYRLIDALNMVGFLFATLLLPMFSRITDKVEQYTLWEIAFKLLFTVVIIGTLTGFVYRQEILSWLYIAADVYYGDVFVGLIFSFSLMTIAYLFGIMVTAKGNLFRLNVVYGIGVLINWTLNFLWIPKYMAEGAAYATLITQFIVLAGLIYLTMVDLNFRIRINLIVKAIVYFLISGLIYYLFKGYFSTNWVMGMSFSILGTIIVSFMLGFLRLEFVNQILKKEI